MLSDVSAACSAGMAAAEQRARRLTKVESEAIILNSTREDILWMCLKWPVIMMSSFVRGSEAVYIVIFGSPLGLLRIAWRCVEVIWDMPEEIFTIFSHMYRWKQSIIVILRTIIVSSYRKNLERKEVSGAKGVYFGIAHDQNVWGHKQFIETELIGFWGVFEWAVAARRLVVVRARFPFAPNIDDFLCLGSHRIIQ